MGKNTVKGPQTIQELVERLAAQAKRLPKEQAQAVASCLEHALRGSQDDKLYDLVDTIYDHTAQPSQPILQIDTMNGDINALEPNNHDHSNQQSQRKFQSLHDGAE